MTSKPTKAPSFVKLVAKLRRKQKAWWLTRAAEALSEMHIVERQADRRLRDLTPSGLAALEAAEKENS